MSGSVPDGGRPIGQDMEKFDLQSTVSDVWNAVGAVICHILFDAAIQGFLLAGIILIAGLVLFKKGHRFGKPLLFVARRIGLVCVFLTFPGIACYFISGKLPDAGVYNINFLGFDVFWLMVCTWLCAEEMNFQWWVQGPPPSELNAEEEIKKPYRPSEQTESETVSRDNASEEPAESTDRTGVNVV